MYFNTKTVLSALMILLCGICIEGEAKSKKKKDKHSSSHSKSKKSKKHKQDYSYTTAETTPVTIIEAPKTQPIAQPPKVEEKPVVKIDEVKTVVAPEVVKDTYLESETLKEEIAAEPAEYVPEHAEAPFEHVAEQHEASLQTEIKS